MIRRPTCLLLAGALLVAGLLPYPALAATDPVSLVQDTAGRILDQLDANHEDYQANPEKIQAMVRTDLMPLLDIRYSARLILGREGRGASAEQIDAFADAMSNVLIERYAQGLLNYRNRDQLEVLPLRGETNEKMTKVRTRVRMDNGNHIPVDYVFRKTGEGWKAFDVIVEGISYVTTYRNQIMPEVQATGIEAVTARLRRGDLQLNEDP